MHTYRSSPVLVLGIVTGSTKVLGNWPEGRKNEKISAPVWNAEDYMHCGFLYSDFTCDSIFDSEQPKFINNTEHFNDISSKQREFFRDAGEELKHGTHHRSSLHVHSSPEHHTKTKQKNQICHLYNKHIIKTLVGCPNLSHIGTERFSLLSPDEINQINMYNFDIGETGTLIRPLSGHHLFNKLKCVYTPSKTHYVIHMRAIMGWRPWAGDSLKLIDNDESWSSVCIKYTSVCEYETIWTCLSIWKYL